MARTEIIAQFVEGTTKACRSFNGSKAAHRIGALFDSTVVLLQSIVEIFARSMVHIAAHYLTNCSWIGTVPIGCHLIRHMPNYRHCLLEKSLSRLHVPLLAYHGIYQIAILINCPIQITPFPMHF